MTITVTSQSMYGLYVAGESGGSQGNGHGGVRRSAAHGADPVAQTLRHQHLGLRTPPRTQGNQGVCQLLTYRQIA